MSRKRRDRYIGENRVFEPLFFLRRLVEAISDARSWEFSHFVGICSQNWALWEKGNLFSGVEQNEGILTFAYKSKCNLWFLTALNSCFYGSEISKMHPWGHLSPLLLFDSLNKNILENRVAFWNFILQRQILASSITFLTVYLAHKLTFIGFKIFKSKVFRF